MGFQWLHHPFLFPWTSTMWGSPVGSWFINPSNNFVISAINIHEPSIKHPQNIQKTSINHNYWSYKSSTYLFLNWGPTFNSSKRPPFHGSLLTDPRRTASAAWNTKAVLPRKKDVETGRPRAKTSPLNCTSCLLEPVLEKSWSFVGVFCSFFEMKFCGCFVCMINIYIYINICLYM